MTHVLVYGLGRTAKEEVFGYCDATPFSGMSYCTCSFRSIPFRSCFYLVFVFVIIFISITT